MSNRLVTRRESMLLWSVAAAILVGSLVTVWMEARGRSPVEKEPAVAAAADLPSESDTSVPAHLAAGPAAAEEPPKPDAVATSQEAIVVEVAGSVRRPGVYQFARGETVADAIDRAGGLTDTGDTTPLNRAAPLLPATKLVVPAKPSAARVDGRVVLTVPKRVEIIPQYRADWPGELAAAAVGAQDGGLGARVNVNTASREELETLPGIGPKTAQAIIEYRRARPFGRIEDITRVRGIGPKTLERLRPLVTVGGPR